MGALSIILALRRTAPHIAGFLVAVIASAGLVAIFRHRSNQERVGQGIANIAAAPFGGLPATGAIARSATSVRAGGRTPRAGIFHAVFLLVAVLLIADLMRRVPMAVLAAILFLVVCSSPASAARSPSASAATTILDQRPPDGRRQIIGFMCQG